MNYWKSSKSVFFCILITLLAHAADQQIESPQSNPTLAIIFDLNGVIFDADNTQITKEILCMPGIWYVIQKTLSGNAPASIFTDLKLDFFTILKKCAPEYINYSGTKDPDGTLLPGIMVAWQEGNISCNEVKKLALKELAKHPRPFGAHQLLENIIKMTFTSKKFIPTRKLNQQALHFIKTCKKKGYEIHILSNWDGESFALLQKNNPQLFALFAKENIIISGFEGHAKPLPFIYHTVRRNLAPTITHTIFIDDQIENLMMGKRYNWFCIHAQLKNGTADWKTIKTEFAKIEAQLKNENQSSSFSTPLP